MIFYACLREAILYVFLIILFYDNQTRHLILLHIAARISITCAQVHWEEYNIITSDNPKFCLFNYEELISVCKHFHRD